MDEICAIKKIPEKQRSKNNKAKTETTTKRSEKEAIFFVVLFFDLLGFLLFCLVLYHIFCFVHPVYMLIDMLNEILFSFNIFKWYSIQHGRVCTKLNQYFSRFVKSFFASFLLFWFRFCEFVFMLIVRHVFVLWYYLLGTLFEAVWCLFR